MVIISRELELPFTKGNEKYAVKEKEKVIGDKLKTVSIFKITGRNWAVQSALNSQ